MDEDDLIRWRAVDALGYVVDKLTVAKPELGREIIRRLFWALNDESGGNAKSAPEAAGSIISRQPDVYCDYISMVFSFLDDDSLRQGVLWTVAQIGRVNSNLVKNYAGKILPLVANKDPEVRIHALYALGIIKVRLSAEILEKLQKDESQANIYLDGELRKMTVRDITARFWGGCNLKSLFISTHGFEDMELFYPFYRLKEAGLEVVLSSVEAGPLKGIHGYQIKVDLNVDSVKASAYDILVLPGGRAPQALRKNETVLALTKEFFSLGKPVAAICHGPQILISAGLVSGKRMTAYKKVQPELSSAGAVVFDQPVVVDGRLITSREPADLPFFSREIIKALGL